MKMVFPLFFFATILVGCGDKASSDIHAPPLSFTATQASNALSLVSAFITTDRTPRDAGTPGAERAAKWLHKHLTALGIDATIDHFTDATPRGEKDFFNVLATLPGKSGEWIVLLSHFDTMNGISKNFQGANDGGSSSGLLLELARMIHSAAPLKHNILCGFMDGEECMLAYSDRDGFHGSKRLANAVKQEKRKIKAVILMDMVGDRDLKITIPRNCSPALRVLALEAAEATGDRTKIGLFDGSIFDDHQAFIDRGFPAVDLIDFHYGSAPGENDYWHTPKDSIDKLSADSLLTTGRIVTEMLNRL